MAVSAEDEFAIYCEDNILTDNPIYARNEHWFVLPAVLIILGYSLLEKRRHYKKHIFGGRPASVKPFSFLDENTNRWGIMLVFGSITGSIIQVTQKTFSAKFPIWAKIFLVYVLCLEKTVVCYPLFASMTNRHKLVGAIVGLLYSVGWFAFEMFINIQLGRCLAKYQVEYTNVAAHNLIQEFPVMLCNFLLILKFSHKLWKCIKTKNYKLGSDSVMKVCSSHHQTYVRHLLHGKPYDSPSHTDKMSIKERIRRKILMPVPGFKYPIAIVITTFMSTVMLYMVGLYCAEFMELFYKSSIPTDFRGLLNAANTLATIATFVIGFRNIFVFINNYKRDVLRLFKGDRSFIQTSVMSPSPNVYMARGIRFIGTAIVGTLWGTVISYLVIFVPLATTLVVFKYIARRGKLDDLLEQLQWILYPVCMIIIFQLQVRLIGCFFIQPKLSPTDKYKPLAVDNRNVYDILAFFMLFLNASIGLFLFLRRILTGALLGMFLIPRMDRSLLMNGYESMDKCYVNYIGMLMVDVTHNNPTMRVFCHVIQMAVNRKYNTSPQTVENPVYTSHAEINRFEGVNSRARKRWFLAYTLIKNPKLVQLRKWNFKPADVDIDDIKTVVEEPEVDSDTTGNCVIKCCRKQRVTIPPNISTNGAAMAVLLMIAFLFAGLPLLLEDVQFVL